MAANPNPVAFPFPTKPDHPSVILLLPTMIMIVTAGFPHNPYNGVICNDVVAASGVFTTKELWKFAKCEFLKKKKLFTINSEKKDFTLKCCSLNNGRRLSHAEHVQLDQAGEPGLLLQLVHPARRRTPGPPRYADGGTWIQ